MSASPQLPPSGRDFLVYQRVVVDSLSTRLVAEEAKISQTRVRQIVLRVMQWLAITLPQSNDIDESGRLHLSQHVAADRLEALYRDTMNDWRSTKQPKFAGLAIRVIMSQVKLPALPGTLEALAADAIDGPLPDDFPVGVAPDKAVPRDSSLVEPAKQQQRCEPASSRPVRECSPRALAAPPTAPKPSTHPGTTSAATKGSEDVPVSAHAARRAFLSPAHLSNGNGNDPPVTELKITPQTLGLAASKPLTRKERRRLRRKLGA